MKESIGNSMVFTWVIVFLFLTMLLIMGSLMYSRAFKNRNEMITIIESNLGYNAAAAAEIETFLETVGYRRSVDFRNRDINNSCRAIDNYQVIPVNSAFLYCIYHHNEVDMFKVVIFLYLDIPIIGEFVSFPVEGETRVFVNWQSGS